MPPSSPAASPGTAAVSRARARRERKKRLAERKAAEDGTFAVAEDGRMIIEEPRRRGKLRETLKGLRARLVRGKPFHVHSMFSSVPHSWGCNFATITVLQQLYGIHK